jgi:hypothetical protein
MTRADIGFGLACAGVAAVTLLLFSDDSFAAAAGAVVACLVIGSFASWLARRFAGFSVEALPWPARALVFFAWWALGAAAVTRIADLLVLHEGTARTIFFVLLGLGAAWTVLGEFANRQGAQGSGRASQ